jgi:hypothetical protein
MKRLFCGAMILALAAVFPLPTRAELNINIGISLPPPIVFHAPPDVIVLPDTTDVYVVPSVDIELFFWNGWWWRHWEGRWYRSHYHNRGRVPSFYFDVDPGWRKFYRDRHWHGHRWNYKRISNRQLQRNWKSWHNDRHWERQGAWGVRDYRPQSHRQRQELRHQRQEQYQQRPEVQRHQQQVRQQKNEPRVWQPQRQQRQYDQPGNQQHHGHSQQHFRGKK